MNDFGDDPWVLTWSGLGKAGLIESLFSLANGRIGIRASLEQGGPVHTPGTLLNGFYEIWPIRYPEAGHGYAQVGQTIVPVADATGLAVLAEEAVRSLDGADVTRSLDLRRGTLEATVEWPDLTLTWTRIVSLVRPHLVVIRVEGASPDSRFHSGWIIPAPIAPDRADFDPRQAAPFPYQVLTATSASVTGGMASAVFVTQASELSFALALEHEARSAEVTNSSLENLTIVVSGASIEKRIAYLPGSSEEEARSHLDSTRYSALIEEQREHLTHFWNSASVAIGAEARLQQAANWNIFQLHQASATILGTGIPAKGLSGEAYEGHYFWDTDVFVLPFLAHHQPEAAAELIRFRHTLLPAARERARVLSQKGALYPWRTISGEEASAYYEAGTAQYHINAAVVFGIDTYLRATADVQILLDGGLEIAFETARLWADLGHYRGGAFHFSMVTGPDEYSALVDDNAYTNYMARFNLERAVAWWDWAQAEYSRDAEDVAQRVDLLGSEIDQWRRLIDDIYLPFEGGLTPQDASFLHRKPWDWSIPADRYPLLLHFHPLVIYRHQVIKQADVVMAMYLLPDRFPEALAQANFDFYDPLTTGDSSLSPSIQAAVAARLGREGDALDYFQRASFLDFDNLAGNTSDGIHLANAGGVWQALVGGFGGFTHTDRGPRLDPHLPRAWTHLSYRVRVSGSVISVEVEPDRIWLQLIEGKDISVELLGEPITIDDQRRSHQYSARWN